MSARTAAVESWSRLSLVEQLGNIGSEVGRIRIWRAKNPERADGAYRRALDLFDLTIADPRWRYRLREITRARAALHDVMMDSREFGGSIESLENYFGHFARCARRDQT